MGPVPVPALGPNTAGPPPLPSSPLTAGRCPVAGAMFVGRARSPAPAFPNGPECLGDLGGCTLRICTARCRDRLCLEPGSTKLQGPMPRNAGAPLLHGCGMCQVVGRQPRVAWCCAPPAVQWLDHMMRCRGAGGNRADGVRHLPAGRHLTRRPRPRSSASLASPAELLQRSGAPCAAGCGRQRGRRCRASSASSISPRRAAGAFRAAGQRRGRITPTDNLSSTLSSRSHDLTTEGPCPERRLRRPAGSPGRA